MSIKLTLDGNILQGGEWSFIGELWSTITYLHNDDKLLTQKIGESKLLTINWKYILELWELRNKEVHSDTPTKAISIKRQHMIDKILHIQKKFSPTDIW
jgi:hypothetical protein